MSKKETQNTEPVPEKIVTRYDRKMQKRKEQKEKARRQELIGRTVGIALLAVMVCVAVSFPIRNWLAVNGTYLEVNGEKITKAQFDYHYNVASKAFINQNYYMYYYFGIDLSGDLSKQMYSETLTWKDHFEELAVKHIAQVQGLVKEGQAAGFTYDASQEYDTLMDTLASEAKQAGTALKKYLQEMYGPYATPERLRPYLETSMYATAYCNDVAETMSPSMAEIEKQYNDNKNDYDVVDYYVTEVSAELPTEPTELADPAEENKDAENSAEGTGEPAPYQPSEAEIAAAMAAAKEKAENAQAAIRKDGELHTKVPYTSATALLRSWLFDAERKSGDVTVIEDSSGNRYYVLGFEDRYLDKTRTVDVRLIATDQGNGQEILDEWKNGAATEESFAELCGKYNTGDLAGVEGGLREGVAPSKLEDELRDWLTDSARQKGDTTVISPEGDTQTYVIYYLAPGEEEWVVSIRDTLQNEKLSDYVENFSANVEVSDPRGNLNYLKVRAQEEADAANATPTPEPGSTEGSDASEGSEGAK